MNWTIRNRRGDVVADGVVDILEWLKTNRDVLVVARMDRIKELIVY